MKNRLSAWVNLRRRVWLLGLGFTLVASASVGATLVDSQPSVASTPIVAPLPDGGWVVAWSSYNPSTLPEARIRFLDSSGAPRSPVRVLAPELSLLGVGASSVAVGSDGLVLVVYGAARYGSASLWARRFAASGEPLGTATRLAASTPTETLESAAAAPLPTGGWLAAWTVRRLDVSSRAEVRTLRLDPAGSLAGSVTTLSPADGGSHEGIALAQRPDGLVAAWVRTPASGTTGTSSTEVPLVLTQRLDVTGEPLAPLVRMRIEDGTSQLDQSVALSAASSVEGRAIWLSSSAGTPTLRLRTRRLLDGTPVGNMSDLASFSDYRSSPTRPRLASDLRGRFLASWVEAVPGSSTEHYQRVTQAFGPGAVPLTARKVLEDAVDSESPPGVAMQPDGKWAVVWAGRSGENFAILAEIGSLSNGCEPDELTLCLTGGRFRVAAEWEDHAGRRGVGHAQPLAAESGAFWFFSPGNVELVVKVLDACGLPDFRRYWVFASGLTDVAVDLAVTDTETGESWSLHNPKGRPFPPVQDTAALHGCP